MDTKPNRISELRLERHMSQQQLGDKLNISQYTVSTYENGKHQLTMDMLISLAELFGVSIDYIARTSNSRYRADDYNHQKLTESEMKLLELFRSFTMPQRERVMGVLLALQQVL